MSQNKPGAKSQEERLEELLREFAELARAKLKAAINVAPKDYLTDPDDFRVTKAVMDSVCRDRPFAPRLPQHKSEFDNIHTVI